MSGTVSEARIASEAGIAARNRKLQALGDGELLRGASLQELLDHTWHYQSLLVSPAFSPAAVAAAARAIADEGLLICADPAPPPSSVSDCGYVSLASLIHNSSSPPSSRHPPAAAANDLAAMVGADEIEPQYLQHRRLRLSHIFRFVRNLQIMRSSSPSCRDSSVRRSAAASRQIGAVAA